MKQLFSILPLLFFLTNINAQTTIFRDNFENGFNAAWSFNLGTNGLIDIQDEIGIEGAAARLGTETGNITSTQSIDLNIDLSNWDDIELSFWILSQYDETNEEDGIYLSNDGGINFYKVLDFKPANWCPNDWGSYPPLDIDDLARNVEIQPGVFGLNLTSNFVIRFQQKGSQRFANGTSSDGFYIDEVHVYDPELAYYNLAEDEFFDDFESAGLSTFWSVNFSNASTQIDDVNSPMNWCEIVNETGLDETRGLVMGRRCRSFVETTNNTVDLHLNLSETPDVEMSFWILSVYDETDADDGIYFSNDAGETFYKALDFLPSNWCPNDWGTYPPLDIDDIARQIELDNGSVGLDLTDRFVVRFQQRGNDRFNNGTNSDGYFIDDVRVYEPGLIYHNLAEDAFFDDFEASTLNASWSWNFADASSSFDDLNSPLSWLEVVNEAGYNESRGLVMGRRCRSSIENTTNAVDLHLDLSETPDIEMSFRIFSIYDDTDVDDGIYFSNDAGATFYKALQFEPSQWCPLVWGEYVPLDIDQMAREIEIDNGVFGLDLTDKFIIRIQQRGNDRFTSGTGSDGFYIDDVHVYQTDLIYHDLSNGDFFDDFEESDLNNSWSRNFANASSNFEDLNSPMKSLEIFNEAGYEDSRGLVLSRVCGSNLESSTNAIDLHLDLSSTPDIEMSFLLFSRYDDTDVDDGIFFSNDAGATFHKVLDFNPSNWCPNVWGQFAPLDIDDMAEDVEIENGVFGLELTDKFIIRIQQRGNQDFLAGTNSDGLYLDNVRVYQPGLIYHDLAEEEFFDDFELTALNNSWSWNFAEGSTSFEDANSPLSLVGIMNEVGYEDSRGLVMSRRCNSSNEVSTNAMDLHLDLSSTPDVEMSFWIQSIYDDTDVDDGIYFSNDAGVSFFKVMDFDPSTWCPTTWGKFPPLDLDELAGNVEIEDGVFGLEFTEEFVVRIQQRGSSAFTSGSNSHGFYIDEVHVYKPTLVFHELASDSFEDDFELDNFNQSWKWSFADATSVFENITSPLNLVEIQNSIGQNNTRGVVIGRRCSGQGMFFSTNAFDLHLNLSETENIGLNFSIRNLGNVMDSDDGIYFSDDSGQSFSKVYEFGDLNNSDFEERNIELSVLAMQQMLDNQSENFIVRFQQRGDGNGFILDNINIDQIVTSIDALNKSLHNYELSPNPVSSFFEIKRLTTASIDKDEIVIFDLNGNIVKTDAFGASNYKRIDVTNFPVGLYLVKIIRDGQSIYVNKFIKS